MAALLVRATLAILCVVSGVTVVQAGTFQDDFGAGIDPAFWTASQTTPGLYAIDAAGGAARFAKVGTTPGGLQYVGLGLNLNALGGVLSGDFSVQVEFRDASIGGGGLNQVELHTMYGSGAIFYAVRDTASGGNVHVWTGTFNSGFPTTATSGTLGVTRTSGLLAAYLDGALIWSGATETSPLTGVAFTLQNNLGSNDAISVTFDNTARRRTTIHARARFDNRTATTRTVTLAALGLHLGSTSLVGPLAVRLPQLPLDVAGGASDVSVDVPVPIPMQARPGTFASVGLTFYGQHSGEIRRRDLGAAACLVEIVP